jgi:F0F1-type ATP synthase assembly protein I
MHRQVCGRALPGVQEVPSNRKTASSLTWLGKYLSLALTLPASVFAGYILGALAYHWLHIAFLRVLGIALGMAAGLYQVIRELSRESKRPNT